MLTAALLGLMGSTTLSAFQEPLVVAEPQRLALTPMLDGKFESNEWDAFSAEKSRETYFQWEPGKIHAAARVRDNEDLIVSLDLKSNGWLIGSDNLQYRVSVNDGKPTISVSRLNAGQASGPIWIDEPVLLEGAKAAVSKDETGWFVELSASDPTEDVIPRNLGATIGVRIDPFEHGKLIEPYIPRAMTATELVFERGSSVPGGLRWNTQIASRTIAPGEAFSARFTFNGVDEMGLNNIAFETRGAEVEQTAELSYPFPKFDRKGRAFVDYKTPLAADAKPGYRVVRAIVTDKSGASAFLRTCFRVAPIIEIDIREPKGLKSSDKDQKIKVPYYVNSNRLGRVSGKVDISTPGGWLIESGDEKNFLIANSRSGVRRVFEVVVPAKSQGRYPITLTATVGEKTFSQSSYILVN